MDLPHIILASGSPRRRELLTLIGVTFDVISPDVDESLRAGEPPIDYVRRLAREKAESIAASHPHRIVLGSDTSVILDGRILGKPVDAEDAVRMLSELSGRTHTVYTGYAVMHGDSGRSIVSYGEANVTFYPLERREIERYVAGGSPLDKAGSYGIQDDRGALFIDRIDGDYYTIVGLPIAKVYRAIVALIDGITSSTGHV